MTSSDLQSGCAPLKVTFTNASVFEAGVSYIWNFGTGAPPVQSQEASRQIVYDNPGVYIVSLTASGSLGKITDTVTIRVFAPPIANFSYFVRTCAPTFVDYTNSSSQGDAAIIEYKWNFGDGKYYYTPNYSKEYIAQAVYESYLKVTDANGCSSELTQEVPVYTRPSSVFSLDTNFSCNPPLRVTASLIEQVEPWVVYEWDFGTELRLYDQIRNMRRTIYFIKAPPNYLLFAVIQWFVWNCGFHFAMYYGKIVK